MRSSKKTQKKERGLNIIIVGCGKVGSTLVEKLSKESHDITVIDQKNEVIQRITEDYDVMGFTGMVRATAFRSRRVFRMRMF